ncbi:hypothetical protein ACFLTJ_03220, partial [Chloroflexota bacterium]
VPGPIAGAAQGRDAGADSTGLKAEAARGENAALIRHFTGKNAGGNSGSCGMYSSASQGKDKHIAYGSVAGIGVISRKNRACRLQQVLIYS